VKLLFEPTILEGCFMAVAEASTDERGWFMRVFCEEQFNAIRKHIHFRQINHSFNRVKGTFRGFHYQDQPHAEEKLVYCVSGSALDIAVDMRMNSPTFLRSVSVELTADNRRMIFIPKGVAHGFQTLEDNTALIYHHTGTYVKEAERGLQYRDPMIHVELPLPVSCISEKDKNYPLLTPGFKGVIL